jgi:hypothetical protein
MWASPAALKCVKGLPEMELIRGLGDLQDMSKALGQKPSSNETLS